MKKETQKQDKPKQENVPASILRIIKIGNCTSLSGKSDLIYHVGCTQDNEVSIRVASNSSSGFFSPEWIALKAILDALEHGHKPLTSYALWPLFRGKSANTPGFLFAALLMEGLVKNDDENPRVYVALPPDGFVAEMNKLMTSSTNLKCESIPTGRKTAPTPKKTAPSKPTQKKAQPEVHKA